MLATLDVLASLAELADRAQLLPAGADRRAVWRIVDGRHPVLDQTLPPGTFVPNVCDMGPDEGYVFARYRTEYGRQNRFFCAKRRC